MRIVVLIVLVVLSLSSQAQDYARYRRDSIDAHKVTELAFTIDTNRQLEPAPPLPFAAIRFIDVRYDTSLIGMYSQAKYVFAPIIMNYKINLKGGVAKNLQQYFQHLYAKKLQGTGNELVCFVKHFSLSSRNTIKGNDDISTISGIANLTAEVFYKTGDTYHAAFKIDTTVREEVKLTRKGMFEEIENILVAPLLSLMEKKIEGTNWNMVQAKRAFSETEVQNNYLVNRFRIPILATPMNKGVYKTFQEFRNNQPSISGFVVNPEKHRTFTLSYPTGEIINTNHIFGYSDGHRFWIQRGVFSYPLIRMGNSFVFYVNVTDNMKVMYALDMAAGRD